MIWWKCTWVLVKWVLNQGPGREIRYWIPGFLIQHQKYMFILTDIQTHDLVFLNVYSQRISTWNIGYLSKYMYHRWVFSRIVPDKMGSKLYCSYELEEFFVLICFKWTKGILWLQQSWIIYINKCTFTKFLAPGTWQNR